MATDQSINFDHQPPQADDYADDFLDPDGGFTSAGGDDLFGDDAVTVTQWPIYTASEFFKSSSATVRWIVKGVTARGLITNLVAAPKTGKTYLVLGLLAEHLERKTALGMDADYPVGILFMTEQGSESLMPQLPPALQNAEDWPDTWHIAPLFDPQRPALSLPGHIAAAKAFWPEGNPPDLLVIDTYGKWSGVEDISDYGDTNQSVTALNHLVAAWPDCAILLLHHARKARSRTATEASLGSQALAGASDINLWLTGGDGETDRKLGYQGRVETPLDALAVLRMDEATRQYHVLDDEAVQHARQQKAPPPDRQKSATEIAIETALKAANEPVTDADLYKVMPATGRRDNHGAVRPPSAKTVRRYLDRMVSDGRATIAPTGTDNKRRYAWRVVDE